MFKNIFIILYLLAAMVFFASHPLVASHPLAAWFLGVRGYFYLGILEFLNLEFLKLEFLAKF